MVNTIAPCYCSRSKAITADNRLLVGLALIGFATLVRRSGQADTHRGSGGFIAVTDGIAKAVAALKALNRGVNQAAVGGDLYTALGALAYRADAQAVAVRIPIIAKYIND